MSLKRKHVNFVEDIPSTSNSAGGSVHPDRLKNTQSTGRAEAKAAKKAKKSVAKQRYLVKKAQKKRKIASAKKASAPKNKLWKGDGIVKVESEPVQDSAEAKGENHGDVRMEDRDESQPDRTSQPNAEAGPSRLRVQAENMKSTRPTNGDASEADVEGDRQERKKEKQERRAMREARLADKKHKKPGVEGPDNADLAKPVQEAAGAVEAAEDEQRRKKERLKKRKKNDTSLETGQKILEPLPSDTQAAGASDTTRTDNENINEKSREPAELSLQVDDVPDEAAERERRKREKREKRANRDAKRKERPQEEKIAMAEADDADTTLDVPSGLTDHDRLTSPRTSPPALEAFPLPRPAPAPDPRILAQQGLPVGLTDATFLDQDLRMPLGELEYSRQGVRQKGVSERMGKRLAETGVEDFFAVQAAILPKLLPLRLVPNPCETLHDYLISAPTGSGKTLAYAIPIVEILSQRCVTRLRALIVLPTKDLVVQVRETMEVLAKGTDLKIGSVTGQHSFSQEQGQLVADLETPLLGGSSRLDVLIATPGRLMDHLAQTPNFSLQHLRFLVIDEADRLLNQSFQNWLAQVLSHILPLEKSLKLPPDTRRQPFDSVAQAWQERPWYEGSRPIESPCQKLLFSATLTRDPQAIAALNLRSPQYYIVQSSVIQQDAASFGENFALPTSLVEKMLILPPALKPLNLIHLIHHPEHKIRGGLVFTKSVESAARLVKLLEYFEEAWVAEKVVVKGYTSEMKPAGRKRLQAEFAEGTVHLLICSDLIARGMDLPTVAYVISYDVPLDMRKYVHRVGRTARAGRTGTAWTLVEKQEALHFKGLLKAAGREKTIRKVKVKEEELAPYRESYEIAMQRLKEYYGGDS